MDTNAQLSGIIRADNETVIFAAQDHLFDFYRTDYYRAVGQNTTVKIRHSEDGYIKGITHNGQSIAIFTNNGDLEILTNNKLRTAIYIVRNGSQQEDNTFDFTSIKFSGGILNDLFTPKALIKNSGSGNFSFEAKQDELVVPIHLNGTDCRLSINSVISGTQSEIANKKVELTVHLNRVSSISLFACIYTAIHEICSFMTMRSNVKFDVIELLSPLEQRPDLLGPRSTCYIYNDFQEVTQKMRFHYIQFEDLGSRIKNLFSLMIMQTNDNSIYYGGFLPKDDDDVRMMNNYKIREICSSIECEIANSEYLTIKSNPQLETLLSEIKALIKEHRAGDSPLPLKTYDYMFGSINHWKASLADQIWEIYQRYEPILDRFVIDHHFRLRREHVDKFTSYRNKLTHGNTKVGDRDVAKTAFVLIALIYCCVLERIGLGVDEIKALIEKSIIS